MNIGVFTNVSFVARCFLLAGIFALPFGVRLFVDPTAGYATGSFVEYAAAAVTLTDIFVLIGLVLFGVALIRGEEISFHVGDMNVAVKPESNFQINFALLRSLAWPTVLLVGVTFLVVPFAMFPIAAFVGAWRLVECLAVATLIASGFLSKRAVIMTFVATFMSQSLLAIAQFFHGGNVGFGWLGESVFDTTTLNVAKIVTETGATFVRGMGMLPHANVFGGLSALALLAVFSFQFSVFRNHESEIRGRIFYFFVSAILTAGVFFSFSRAAWIVVIVGWVLLWFIQTKNWQLKTKNFFVPMIVATLLVIAFFPLVATRANEDVSAGLTRIEQFALAKEVISAHPFGVGTGGYVAVVGVLHSELPAYARAPVHNFFVLKFAEESVLVAAAWILFFLSLAWQLFRSRAWDGFILLGALIALMQVDHYFATSVAGAWGMWIFLALLTDLRSSHHLT